MSLPSSLYAAVARRRRDWYDRHPEARRRLARPVVSIGNLRVGGTGKTPMVAWLARELVAAGERPSILTRGYARRDPVDGVVVASDGTRVLAPVARTGDEPQMLARALAGVPVLVGPDRYLAGRLAESRFGCTMHLLDDGFQHLRLDRDVDLLMVGVRDLREAVLPTGRLREALEAAVRADALCVSQATEDEARQVASSLGVARAFRVNRRLGAPGLIGAAAPRQEVIREGRRVLAVAGIAEPQQFFNALRSDGWDVGGELAFRDHHAYSTADLDRISARARVVGADLVLTTEKDAVRLAASDTRSGRASALPFPLAVVPLVLDVEAGREMMEWLRSRLAAARVAGGPKPSRYDSQR